MHVLYIGQMRPDRSGTTSQKRAYQQISSLLKRNHFVYCLFQEKGTVHLIDGEEAVENGSKSIYSAKTGRTYMAVMKNYMLNRYPLCVSRHSFPEIRRMVHHIMKEVHFDIIHIQSHMIHNFPDIDRWVEPVVVDYIEAVSLSLERRYKWTNQFVEKAAIRGELGRVRAYEARLGSSAGNQGIVSSEADRHRLSPVTIERLAVVPDYIEESFFSESLRTAKKPAILFTGPFTEPEYKDAAVRLVNEIFPMLKKQIPALVCWLGSTEADREVKQLAQQKDVELFSQPEDIEQKLKEAALYICPLRFSHGHKTSLLQAAAAGCPIVLSQAANEAVRFRDGKEARLAAASESFGEQAKSLLGNQVKRLLLAAQARLHVQAHFSEEHAASQLLAAYRKAGYEQVLEPMEQAE